MDSTDDCGRGLPWLLDGTREALAAVAGRRVREPVHGRDSLPGRDRATAASEEVAGLLRRLGYGNSSRSGKEPPPDEPTEPNDERLQEQRPG